LIPITYDTWITRESEPYEESPPPVDPRDEAYTEACEEIARLKRIIERLERELEKMRCQKTS
jgi:ubiquinone biosynthesis protein UbiJ